MSTAAPVRGFVFDAYGTLFDVHSIVSVGREVTADPQALSATWRQKQLEYTWLRALMGRYEDFWTVTEAALRYAIRRLALTASEAQIHRLMDAYLSLACFPEVKAALGALAPQPRAILSNGSPRMLEAAVASPGKVIVWPRLLQGRAQRAKVAINCAGLCPIPFPRLPEGENVLVANSPHRNLKEVRGKQFHCPRRLDCPTNGVGPLAAGLEVANVELEEILHRCWADCPKLCLSRPRLQLLNERCLGLARFLLAVAERCLPEPAICDAGLPHPSTVIFDATYRHHSLLSIGSKYP